MEPSNSFTYIHALNEEEGIFSALRENGFCFVTPNKGTESIAQMVLTR
jgi:hypothetical protein